MGTMVVERAGRFGRVRCVGGCVGRGCSQVGLIMPTKDGRIVGDETTRGKGDIGRCVGRLVSGSLGGDGRGGKSGGVGGFRVMGAATRVD